jgi:hypothetical protein
MNKWAMGMKEKDKKKFECGYKKVIRNIMGIKM